MSYSRRDEASPIKVAAYVIFGGATALALVIALIMGAIAASNSFSRYQKQADAKNNVKVAQIDTQTAQVKANNKVKITEIEIQNQEQRVKIAQQQAQIRLEEAKGVRAAQDEISKTLTPLYVQLELSKSLEHIAKSGKNSSVIYIPTGANGLPVTSVTPNK